MNIICQSPHSKNINYRLNETQRGGVQRWKEAALRALRFLWEIGGQCQEMFQLGCTLEGLENPRIRFWKAHRICDLVCWFCRHL